MKELIKNLSMQEALKKALQESAKPHDELVLKMGENAGITARQIWLDAVDESD